MEAWELRRLFEGTNIIQLQQAARIAGVKFRSGALTKAQIIDTLMNYTAMACAAAAVLQRTGGTPPPQKSAMSWDDDVPQSLPPMAQPAPATLDASILAQYVKRTELAAQRSEWDAIADALAARVAELEQRRPVAFQLQPTQPPKIPQGLTHPKFPLLVQCLAIGEPCYLVGPASSGKTTAAKQARDILAALFEREDYPMEATGAVSDAFALLGYRDAQGRYVETAFYRAVKHGGLFLFDEVDASAGEALLVINSLDNGFVMFPEGKVDVHPHFRLILGGNTDGSGATMEFNGRSRLDGAFLDRATMIEWAIDARIEEHLARGENQWLAAVRAIRAFVREREINDTIATARAVRRGPLLAAQGMGRMDILEVTCKRGALRECWADVLRIPAVATYLRG